MILIFWIAETVILFMIPFALLYKRNIPPFSTALDKWYRKYTLDHFFEYIVTANQVKTDFENNGIAALEKLGKGIAFRYGQISIYYLKNDPTAYLSITNISIEKKGQGKKNENTFLHAFKITAQEAEMLMEKYRTKREYFLEH